MHGHTEKQNKPPRPIALANLSGSKLHLSGKSLCKMHLLLLMCLYVYIASEMWNFSILLPLIIGDKFPDDDPLWECYLLLLEIVKYSTAELTSLASAEYLAALIHQHHHEFLKCYPTVSITPKMHYMVHLPRLLIK